MIEANETLFISPNFKDILTRGNKYEGYVLDLMNLSNIIFPSKYEKVEKQDNGEPDFVDSKDGTKYDAKLVVSEFQCQQLCGKNNVADYVKEISKQNNEIYDSIINEQSADYELLDLMKKQLLKKSTANKNIVFFFTFPIGSHVTTSITAYLLPNYMTMLLSGLKDVANGREIYAICPTIDGHYEIRKASDPSLPEFIRYSKLDKYFKWSFTR